MFTVEEIQAELGQSGIKISDTMLRLLIGRIDKLNECFERNGYDELSIFMIYVYLSSMVGLFGVDGRIRSQSAPSGASQSFDLQTLGQRWKALSDLLRMYDPEGCAASLIPPDPDKKVTAALWISPGPEGCMLGGR